MSEQTEAKLRNWARDDAVTDDDMHRHMRDFGRWDWCEIADEGRRIYGVMFGEEVESGSAVDAIIGGVSAQAADGAWAAVAAALGVDAEDVRMAVADWYEKQDATPPPVSPDRFMELIAEAADFHASLPQRGK